jgi:hypothetical protein
MQMGEESSCTEESWREERVMTKKKREEQSDRHGLMT